MSKIIGIIPFVVYLIGYPVIVKRKLPPIAKKKAIRLFIIFWGLSLILLTVIPSMKPHDAPVLILVLPVIGLMVFSLIKYTKVCPKCGHTVPFERPYVEPKACPKCKSRYESRDVKSLKG